MAAGTESSVCDIQRSSAHGRQFTFLAARLTGDCLLVSWHLRYDRILLVHRNWPSTSPFESTSTGGSGREATAAARPEQSATLPCSWLAQRPTALAADSAELFLFIIIASDIYRRRCPPLPDNWVTRSSRTSGQRAVSTLQQSPDSHHFTCA